ncbi:MAG: peptidase M4 [Rhodospirillales bacterium 20-64-7]|nr:MAG: peptidase M4 [Rhodospirillales bacterium 20-64-7]
MKKAILCGALAGSFGAASLAVPALAYTGQNMAKNAQVSMQQARQAALQAEPGKIKDAELERENGGSGLRYSFDIKPANGGTVHEVGVDANTGKILENSVDNGND